MLFRSSAERLGLVASAESVSDGQVRLRVSSGRFAYGVRVIAPGWAPDDDAFGVEPGGSRDVLLQAATAGAPFAAALTALNLDGRVIVAEAA